MKMSELRLENEALKQQIQLLTEQQGEPDTAALTQLKEKNRALRKSVKDLKAEKGVLTGKIQTLEEAQSSLEQEHQALKAEFEHTQQQLSDLTDAHVQVTGEVESLRADCAALQQKAAQLPRLQAELERLLGVEDMLREKTSQAAALQATLKQRDQLLEEVRAKAAQELAEVQDQQAKLSREMEQARTGLLADLEAQRQQSAAQIASLQAQKDGLSAKVAELTEKLKLVATHLEKQLSEKRKIAYQYETSTKEHQGYKDRAEKQIGDLMSLLQKMAAELDASRAAHPAQATQPSMINADKPAALNSASAVQPQPKVRLEELEGHLAELNEINAGQARELQALSARMKRINRALDTPLGRLLSPLLGLKD